MKKKERIPALLILSGPTASGKSSLAEQLALENGYPILSADSRQIYRRLDIGTAKPSLEIRARIRYEMIDILEPCEKFSAGMFARRAADFIYGPWKNEQVIIIAGGTGFYISALLEGLAPIPDIHADIEQKWNHLLENKGIEYLQQEIKTLDPKFAATGDLHNTHRLLRALKIVDQTDRSVLDYSPKPFLDAHHPTGLFTIHHDRHILYERIDARVDHMIRMGLVEEVRNLLPYRDCPAMNTVGYKEILRYLEQKTTLAEAIEKIKQHSRNYAKRQLTWLRRNNKWTWIGPDDVQPLIQWIDHHQ